MLRNRRRNNGLGYDNGLDMMPYNRPPEPPAQPNLLDNTNERMLDMAETIGLLGKECEMLNEDNKRLEQENQALRENNERLTNQARESAVDSGAHTAVTELVDELKEALKAGKVKK
jgi:FtsZ-binding cell division protein ZapB